jgi:subtilisin family serine protease
MEEAILSYISSHPDWVERSASVIMWICDLLYFLGSRVIAAAGNDWDPADAGRPEARYPAAFGSVQGVGALKKEQPQAAIAGNQHYEVASYSDISDKPGKVGVVTLGGEAGENRGVLGIYLGEFPEPHPKKNTSHWAWWAGTSFATPILSGVIAAVLNKPNPPPTVEGAIVALYRARAIKEAGTDYQEDLLAVTQG